MSIIPYVFGTTLTACSFLFFLLLVFFYYRKLVSYSIKNQIFKRMLWSGFAMFLLEFLYLFMNRYSTVIPLLGFTKKLILLCFFGFILLWIYYVFILIFEKKQDSSNLILQNHATMDIYLIIGFVTVSIIDFFLPIHFNMNDTELVQSVTGAAISFLYLLIIIIQFVPIPLIILHREELSQKKFIPYYIVGVITIIMILVLFQYPSLCIMEFVLTICSVLIYYRLENPDILYVKKYRKNRDQLRIIREKYGFLFNMSPELRDLLNEVSFMKENYLTDQKKSISRKKLETLLKDFIKSGEEGITTQTNIDDDGIEILDLEEEVPDEMLITKEIYSLQELNEVLKEDNLPKW